MRMCYIMLLYVTKNLHGENTVRLAARDNTASYTVWLITSKGVNSYNLHLKEVHKMYDTHSICRRNEKLQNIPMCGVSLIYLWLLYKHQ